MDLSVFSAERHLQDLRNSYLWLNFLTLLRILGIFCKCRFIWQDGIGRYRTGTVLPLLFLCQCRLLRFLSSRSNNVCHGIIVWNEYWGSPTVYPYILIAGDTILKNLLKIQAQFASQSSSTRSGTGRPHGAGDKLSTSSCPVSSPGTAVGGPQGDQIPYGSTTSLSSGSAAYHILSLLEPLLLFIPSPFESPTYIKMAGKCGDYLRG
jgi:hypothetical protein